MKKLKQIIVGHKIISSLVAVVIVGSGIWIGKSYFSDDTTTRSIFAVAKISNIESSIDGSGQVEALDTVDMKSEVSSTEIVTLRVAPGDEVAKGSVIATFDTADAIKNLRSAELSVTNAQVTYEKSQKQFNDQSATSTVSDLKKAYDSGYNAITNAFIDMPTIFQDISDVLYNSYHSPYFSDTQIQSVGGDIAVTYKYQAGVLFDKAKNKYEADFSKYKNITQSSSPEEIKALAEIAQNTLKDLLAGLSGTYSTIDYINVRYPTNVPAQLTTDKNQLNTYIAKVNSHINSLSNALTAIEDAKDSSTESDITMKSAELSLLQAKNSLSDAQEALANHTIRAPFDGVISKVPVQVGDDVSNGTSIATIVTKKQIVTITLNEIDAAKVKVGQKANLTFDAIDDLKMTGTVSEVDVVGTVSQGVVSYSMKIGFDTTDERIKPGMTVTAVILIENKQGVIAVPSSAVKTVAGKSFVQVEDASGNLQSVEVKTGIKNDTSVEIVSGLSEGQKYLVRTVTVSASAASGSGAAGVAGSGSTTNRTPSATSILGGNAVRINTGSMPPR